MSEHSESAQRQVGWDVVMSRTAARSFFAADERLMAYQVYRDSVDLWGQTHSRHGVWEEYWYDALGRRVLVRSLAPSTICDRPGWCVGARTHTVWDGDQVLWERRDADTPTGASHQYGLVGYTHGPGIDTPLDLVKDGATVVIPHQSWRGVYAVGTTPGGAQFGCTPNWFAGCAEMGWPAGKGTAYIGVTEADPPPHWYGSLIRGQRDESGQLYMRNRYYDAKSGRFTQEDPIGLAGGLNLYGFANGDPINFRDPFGLCPEPENKNNTVCIAFFIQADKKLGFKGDGRGFSSSSDPSKSRLFIHVDLDNQIASVTVNESCSAGGTCYDPVPNDIDITFDGQGGFDVNVHAHNSVAPSAPAIDARLSFRPNGKGGLSVSGNRDGFPSAEAYLWRNGAAQTLFRRPERTPFHLYPFMPNDRFRTP